jgi:sugar lactone lactonase YvrE
MACGSSGSTDATNTNPDGGGPGTDGGGPGTDGGGNPDGDGSVTPDSSPPVPCSLLALTTKVATLAGCDVSGTADGARGFGHFANPTNTLIGPDGTTYVSDFDNGLLRAVDTAGTTRTIVKKSGFSRPFGMANAPGGKLYVETDDNDMGMRSTSTGTLWLVDPAASTATVLARNLGRPRGLAVLSDGKIAMADYQHNVISIFDPANASVAPTVLAGTVDMAGYVNDTGAVARFNLPYDIVVLSNGDLAVTDTGNHRIRQVTLAGVVTDFAGSGTVGNDDGAVATATFDAPQGLAISGSTLYVSDVHRFVIRKIEAGQVTTIAGDGTQGWLDADDPKTAKFYGIEGLDVDATRVVIADGNGGNDMPFNHIRVIHLP